MNGYFERGEVYWVRMDTGLGTEQGVGRPGVILTNDDLNQKNTVVTIAFLSRKFHPGQKYVEVYATGEKSYVICHQMMTYDKSRLGKYCGKLNAAEQKAVDDAMEQVLDLGYKDDEALKEKDREIEARDAVIAEKDAEIQSLKDRMKNQEEANADELASLRMEISMWTRMYNKALDAVVDMKFTNDLFLRGHIKPEEPPVTPPVVESAEESAPELKEEPQVKQPVENDEVENERVDINTCTMTALKKLGFSLPMAKKIKEARPFSSVEDLKRVNGLKASMYRVVESKLCCTPVVVAEEPVVTGVVTAEKDPDPGFEPVDINTATGKDLIAVGFANGTAYKITGYRNRNGLFHSVDDLRYVPISQAMIDRFRDHLTVVVTETPEDDTERLNVNEATVPELVAIGFSEILANRIVLYREKNGRFGVIYDLLKVSGVNGKTVKELSDRVRV